MRAPRLAFQSALLRCSLSLFVLLLTLTACACHTTRPRETGFLNRTVIVGGKTFPYTVYVPRDFNSARAWPVVLSLHGAGERGNDGVRQMQIGAAAAIRARPDRIPAVVVFPQAPADTRWIGAPAGAAMLALERSIREFNGDEHRVYVTGLSMGGYGTYHLALAHPHRFAAAIVVCGGLLPHPTTTAVQQSPLTLGSADPYVFAARQLRHLPVWIIHGDADPVIPVEEARRMVTALRAEQAPVRYTEYSGVGHNSWDRAYSDPEVWAWLFVQIRQAKP